MDFKFDVSAMGYSDKESMMKVIIAYMRNCSGEEVMYEGTGMNMNTGYVYIALENGVTIASNFGQRVEYIVTDYVTGEEYFLNSYSSAVRKQEQLNREQYMETEITELRKWLRVWKYPPNDSAFNEAERHLTKVHNKYGTVDISIIKQLIK